MAADLFVSYARKDREHVLPWVQQLQHAGVSLWVDETGIDAAHLWSQEITDALDACRVLLLMLSPAAIASRQVAREVTLASEANKSILPLLLEPTEITGPLRYHLAGVQHLELSGAEPETTQAALLRALARLGVVPVVSGEPTGAAAATPAPVASPASSPEHRASRPSAAPRHNLPEPLTRFIGREREIAQVKEHLAHSRLLTLTGAGGTGKTRLALQVAGELREVYPDGVWLVELAALTDGSLVPQEVATALGVQEEPSRPLLQTLIDALRAKELLLVLDNCEHLIEASAALVHALLRACPGLRLLATSRQALGVPGESLWRVPSLATPAPPPPPVEQLTQYEAVQLFIDRALLGQPSFAVTNENAPAVAAICHRLDGIPLAIELAAARVKLLSVEQIIARLDDRFRLLIGGSRTVLPRQQTLRALIDWSYELLSKPEHILLRRLSVFAGGFTLEAAEAVCADEAIDVLEVLDLLGQLTDKSLVQVDEPSGDVRYHLLETIRQYAAEKLQASGQHAALRARHRDWHLRLAEQAESELKGPTQGEWLGRLEQEHDNLRAALQRSLELQEAVAALRLAGALSRFWEVRGYLVEGRERLAEVLALAGASARTVERAQALNGAAALAYRQGDYGAAQSLQEEGLAIWRELSDRKGIATALNNLGRVARKQGNYEAARLLHQESLAIDRELGDRRGIAISLNHLGSVVREQGDYEAAQSLHEENLAIRRELDDRQGIANSLNNLGLVVHDRGDYEAARLLHEESLSIRRELGDRQGVAVSLGYLGNVASAERDYKGARALYEESLALSRELGDRRGIAESFRRLAAVAGAQGQPQRAARLFGAAEALREAIGAPLSPADRADYEHHVATVRAALDELTFAAAWAAGRALSLEQAVAEALATET